MRLRYKGLSQEEQRKRQEAEARLQRWRDGVGLELRKRGRQRWKQISAHSDLLVNGYIPVSRLDAFALELSAGDWSRATADSWTDGHDDPQPGFVALRYRETPIVAVETEG